MKEFLKIMEKDIHSENFTKREIIIMGVVAPAAFVAVCILVNLLP